MKHVLNLAAVLALAVATQALAAPEPRVYFIEPKDGASVESPVTVKFGLDNFNLKPAGDTTPDSGHHHLIVDGGPIPKGEIIGASETSIHFGKAQTETQLKLSPGKHRLTLQLGDGAHQSYGPDLSASITIDVK
ncbi:conserved hypothetical protein [Methylocella silvestris BL2]|uniref:DUF4399 domain-containing protein n=1 Tax=Methylocella silvestris (strain DSM 15510 / CIP 108128 / LMG 27833 / NCIMB 13906 / BL2) TaxID=395965 RepID=B8EIE9_METSB|nr:DUF4399 domain-containing protein [Methylocella silvestris]ACK51268.1 conserved hypothetical protein [Methylocella silvestris BL2]